ncbi:DNA repair protein RecN [Leucothrix arctica]|uniref:DNA repair protein RecN n=1 Tax=Leucothrix arctica TaxID=1481894 RepID=A0A317CM62_9GAMM|nr:DNA repair protein RecN [Leucothrix arctica]PWQ98533.1 DNA repair protein RecN [Leucothrix arctica]
MLSHIFLRDFAIIETLDLEFDQGMTALTGETGAGKSILVDAIGLVLGDRADSGVVRHGAAKTEITLAIDISDTPTALKWLQEQDLDQDDDCILRRVITSSGKSRAWINGTPANLTMLRQLGEQVVDIHGQHEHQSLMKKEAQRQMVDDYGNHTKLLKTLNEDYKAWKVLNDKLDQLQNQNSDHQAQIDLLSFQTQELEALELVEKEYEQLDEEHGRLSNAGQLLSTASDGLEKLYDAEQNSVYSIISHLITDLNELKSLDSSLEEPLALLTEAQIQVEEASSILRHYQDSLELDPQRLEYVEGRIASLHQMARKHNVMPAELLGKFQDLSARLASLSGDDYDLDALKEKLELSQQAYLKQAEKLHTSRTKAAKQLSKGVSKAMQQLGMDGGVFEIQCAFDVNSKFTAHGLDDIEFQVSANPGQPLKSLVKVASGGELSRISLAIQMIAAQKVTLPALIFDEVDTGIGGGTAEVVGQQLRKLGSSRQVLCVTHLPQVASQAHQHYKVTKVKGNTSTSTGMLTLEGDARVEEISRMMGGIEITDSTRALAREMLESATSE